MNEECGGQTTIIIIIYTSPFWLSQCYPHVAEVKENGLLRKLQFVQLIIPLCIQYNVNIETGRYKLRI